MVADGTREEMRRLLPDRNYIAMNEALAAQEHVKPGDTITLPTPEGPVQFTVAVINVDYSSDSGSILMDMHTYQRYWKEYLADSFSVRVTAKDRTSRRCATRSSEGSGTTGSCSRFRRASSRKRSRKIIDQGFAVNHAINTITLLIASLGIIVTLLASVLERTREIGILRSIGMLREPGVPRGRDRIDAARHHRRSCSGALAGMAIGWMSLEGFLRGDYGASMRYHIDIRSIFWALCLSTLLAALAGLYPARRAAKTNIVEALSYE